jgi:hypothetical protein
MELEFGVSSPSDKRGELAVAVAPDLLIGQTAGGEHRYLLFLRSERNVIPLSGGGRGLPRRPQLAGGPAGPWPGPDAFESSERGRQLATCVPGSSGSSLCERSSRASEAGLGSELTCTTVPWGVGDDGPASLQVPMLREWPAAHPAPPGGPRSMPPPSIHSPQPRSWEHTATRPGVESPVESAHRFLQVHRFGG